MCSQALMTVVHWVVLRECTSLRQPVQVLGSQDVWGSGRGKHDFGTCKENAAVQCRLPTNSAAKHVFKLFAARNPSRAMDAGLPCQDHV